MDERWEKAIKATLSPDDPRYIMALSVVARVEQDRPFECAICCRSFGRGRFESRHGRDRNLAPVCRQCEGGAGYQTGYSTTRRSIPEVKHGAFMDRRIVSQIGALAEALEMEVARQRWNGERYYGS